MAADVDVNRTNKDNSGPPRITDNNDELPFRMDEITAIDNNTPTPIGIYEAESGKTAFISLNNDIFKKKTLITICGELEKQNPEDILPNNISLVNKSTLKLRFDCQEKRDRAIFAKYNLFQLKVDVAKPRPPTISKILNLGHLYGNTIPEYVRHTDVENWLVDKFPGLKIAADNQTKFLPIKDCRLIHSNVRSIKIEITPAVQIPGIVWFHVHPMIKPIKLQLWFHGMETYCRKCMQPGHLRKDCDVLYEDLPKPPPIAKSYATVAAATPAQPVRLEKQSECSSIISNESELPISKIDISDRQNTAINNFPNLFNFTAMTTKKWDYIPFYSYKCILSNHFPCNFTIHEKTYRSTEHYLFAQKARALNLLEKEREILSCEKAATAKRIGDQLKWNNPTISWADFASKTLFEANFHKYAQSKPMRMALFNTLNYDLVETNPYDRFWGIGLAVDDPRITDRRNWGENNFGKILMKLREQMRTNVEFQKEAEKVNRFLSGQVKRGTESLSPDSSGSKRPNFMKILTWNINGIRSLPDTLPNILSKLDSEVVCLQETKLTREALTSDLALIAGYNSYFSFCQKRAGYSGVATFVRNSYRPFDAQDILFDEQTSPKSSSNDSPIVFEKERIKELQNEGRIVITKHRLKIVEELESTLNLHIVNVYCPRNDPDRPERAQYQLDFLKLIEFYCHGILNADRNNGVIVVGDINCAHKRMDHCDPDPDFDLNPARIWLNNFLTTEQKNGTEAQISDLKFVDGFRYFNPNQAKAYTCWDARTFAREKNYGTRIDYILIDSRLSRKNLIQNVEHLTNFMGSDHCPVYVQLSDKVTPFVDEKNIRLPDLCSINLPKFRAGRNFQQKLTNFFEFKEKIVVVKRKKEFNVLEDDELRRKKMNIVPS